MNPERYISDEVTNKVRKFLETIVNTSIGLGGLQEAHRVESTTESIQMVQETARDIGRMCENMLINVFYELNKEDK